MLVGGDERRAVVAASPGDKGVPEVHLLAVRSEVGLDERGLSRGGVVERERVGPFETAPYCLDAFGAADTG